MFFGKVCVVVCLVASAQVCVGIFFGRAVVGFCALHFFKCILCILGCLNIISLLDFLCPITPAFGADAERMSIFLDTTKLCTKGRAYTKVVYFFGNVKNLRS